MCIGEENIDKDMDKFKILCFMELNWVQLSIDFGKVVLSCTVHDVFTCWQSASGCIGGLQFFITVALRKRNFRTRLMSDPQMVTCDSRSIFLSRF